MGSSGRTTYDKIEQQRLKNNLNPMHILCFTLLKNALAEAKKIALLALPIVIGQLANTGTSFVDAVMAGRVSTEDLAAVSLGSSIWISMVITLTGLLLSVTPAISQLCGAKKLSDIPQVVQQGLWLAILLGTAAFFIASFIAPLFQLIDLTPAVQQKATDFLLAIRWGFPAVAIYRVFYGYSASLNQILPLMLTSLFVLLLNIPTNYILIHGLFGFPKLGGVGCGWATAFCMWISALIMGWWINRAQPYRETHPFKQFYRANYQQISQLVKVGGPIGLMFFVEITAFSLVVFWIAGRGTIQIAAHQIAINVSAIIFMIPQSLGTALTVRVGHAIGAADLERARFISWVGMACGFITATFTSLIVISFSAQVAGFYAPNDFALKLLAANLLIYAGIFQFPDAAQVCAAGALRGYKVTRAPMFIYIAAFWLCAIPFGYVLAQAPKAIPFSPQMPWGVEGFWFTVTIGLTIAAVALVWLMHRVSAEQIKDCKSLNAPQSIH